MPYLALDFTRPVPRYNLIVMGVLFVLVALMTAFFVFQQQQLNDVMKRKNSQTTSMENVQTQSKANPDLERQLSAAQQTQRSLNMPWESMLAALEQSQRENVSIKLLSIQPKPEKGEVLITGEAPEFDASVKYLNSLRQQPGLGDAVLLNQHWEQTAGAENSTEHDKLMFNLSVIWLP